MDTQYKYWCPTEKMWIYEWSTSPPTICINESATVTDVSVFRELAPGGREVLVNEQTLNNVDVRYTTQTIHLDVDRSSVSSSTIKEIIFPMDIYIYQIKMFPYSHYSNEDIVDVIINPDYVCGALTADANIGDTVFNISETVFKYATRPGWFIVTCNDGVNTENVGRVVGIDRTNNTITVENALTVAFNTGTLIQIDYYMMYKFEIFTTKNGIQSGASRIGGSLVYANTPIRLTYSNKTDVPKTFLTQLEYTW